MSESEMTSWLTEMRGLFNIFLGYFDSAEDGRREGVDKGVDHVSPESRAKLAANAGMSNVPDEYVETSVGLFVMRMKKAWGGLPLILDELQQVHAPSEDYKKVQKDLEEAIKLFQGYVRLAIEGTPTSSKAKLIAAEPFFISAYEMKESALRKFISLGGKVAGMD
jgi:hypothetical protein